MNRLTILMAAALLAGCTQMKPEAQAQLQAERRQEKPTVPRGELIGVAGYSRIYLFHDNENHNTCYVTDDAIDCVPMAYRNLHQESSNVSYR